MPRQHNFLPQPHLGTSIGLTTLDSCLQLSLFADLCMRACRLLSLIAYAARGWSVRVDAIEVAAGCTVQGANRCRK